MVGQSTLQELRRVNAEGWPALRSANFVSNPRSPACNKAHTKFHLIDIIVFRL